MKKCLLLLIVLLALQFTVIAQAPPSNDECSGARELASFNGFRLNSESTVNATESYDNNLFQCPQNDVWYKVVPLTNGTIKIDTYISGGDYVDIDVFSSASGFVCKSSPGGPMPATYRSGSNILDNVPVTAGTTYYIRLVREFCGFTPIYFHVIITGNAVTLADHDNCSGARLVTYNSTLTNQDNNLSSPSTQFGTLQTIDCNGAHAGSADDDVWYKFVAPQGANGTLISVRSTNGKDPVLMLYTSCNQNLLPVSCANTPGTSEYIWRGGLSANQTYYLRVYTWEPRAAGANGGGMNFEVTVKDSAFIANDNCAGHINLLIPSTGSYNNINASPSSMPLNPSCSGIVAGTADDDVFFSFYPQTNQDAGTVIRVNTTNGTDPVMMIYSFDDCGSPAATPLFCSNTAGASETIWAKFTSGARYFIRIYSWSPNPTPMQFQLTIKDSAFAANDEPCTAMQITYNGGAANQTTSGSTHTTSVTRSANCSTDASGNPLAAGSTGTENDVWYKFTYSPSYGTNGMVVTANSTNATDPVFFLYTGTDCNTLTQVSCSNTNGDEKLRVRDIIPGTVYYLRVHEFFNRPMTFTVEAKDTIFAVNDRCDGSILIPFNTTLNNEDNDNTTGPITYQTACAGPQGFAEDDSWYKFVPTTTTANISVTSTNFTDPVLFLYNANPAIDCRAGGTTLLACYNTPNVISENGFISGLTIGKEYFIRVYDAQIRRSTFNIYAGTLQEIRQITSTGSGDFNNPAIWSCNCVPQAMDEVTIKPTHTVNITAAMGILTIRKLAVQLGGKLNINGGQLKAMKF